MFFQLHHHREAVSRHQLCQSLGVLNSSIKSSLQRMVKQKNPSTCSVHRVTYLLYLKIWSKIAKINQISKFLTQKRKRPQSPHEQTNLKHQSQVLRSSLRQYHQEPVKIQRDNLRLGRSSPVDRIIHHSHQSEFSIMTKRTLSHKTNLDHLLQECSQLEKLEEQ